MLWVLLLFTGGVILILAEFIVPGLICGIIGGCMIIGSCVLGTLQFPEYAIVIIFFEFVGAIGSVLAGIFILPHTPMGDRLVLKESQNKEEGWVSNVTDESLIGAVGEVNTALRPVGTVLIDGRRVDAVSNGIFINRGVTVRVVEVHGNRVVVEEEVPHVDGHDVEEQAW